MVQPDCPAGAPGVLSGAARRRRRAGAGRGSNTNETVRKGSRTAPRLITLQIWCLYNMPIDLSTRFKAISKHRSDNGEN